MSNNFQEGAQGGISFSTPAFTFGTTVPQVNSGYSFDLPMATIQAFANNALSFTSNNTAGNRGFLDSVINRSQSQVSTATLSGMSFVSGVNASVQETVTTAVKKRTRSCYITTAICRDVDKPDDCYELQTFRKFRDEFVMATDEGKKAVTLYYDTAPDIVSFIDARSDAHEVYATLRAAYLMPALRAIERGENHKAYVLYCDMVSAAREFAKEVEHG